MAGCATATPDDPSREATEHGFTLIEGSYRSPKGDTYAEVGVWVGSCTGTYSKPMADGYTSLKIYNLESGVTIADLLEPTLEGVMSIPPAMTACKPSENSTAPTPASTTAR